MRPARLLACNPSALRNVFYSGSLPTFAVCVSGFACLLTLKSISHFRLFVKRKVRCFNPFPNQNAVIHLTLWIIAHSELFVKNFFVGGKFPASRSFVFTTGLPLCLAYIGLGCASL